MTAFVACPACGGPVHQIAGRCKHCKTDLVKLREHYAQVQRAASMGMPNPATAAAASAGPGAPTLSPHQATRAPTPPPLPLAAAMVYPPSYGTAVGSNWSRRWPLLVGGAAILVIAVSLVVLFRGKSDASTESQPGTSRSPRPTTDDMNTPQPQGPLGRNTPVPPADPSDPTPTPPTRPPGQRTAPTDAASFAVALIETMCSRLEDCGVADPQVKIMCAQAGSMDPGALGGSGPQCNVAAVNACFSAIENISCDSMRSGDIGQLLSTSAGIMECTEACI